MKTVHEQITALEAAGWTICGIIMARDGSGDQLEFRVATPKSIPMDEVVTMLDGLAQAIRKEQHENG